MRIRKHPRQLSACRDDFLPCIFQEGGWISREYLEVGNGGTLFPEKAAGLAADPTEQFVAAAAAATVPKIIDHVKPDPNAINISRMYDLQQPGDGRDASEWVPEVLRPPGPKVQQDGQEKSKLPEGRQSGKLPSNFVGKTPKEAMVACGQSSSPSVDTEMTNVDQMEFSGPSNYLECYTQDEDEDNPTRHYVRRGLRNGGDSVTQHPFGETIPVEEDVFAAISKTNSYECDRFPYSERKVKDSSNRHNSTRSAIPCDSNEDEDHPSREPEGSLLHSLYLQLLAAGRDGISLRGLFASFESQTSLPRLASNWREKVKSHLKSGPYFEEVKGRYILCEFLVQPSSKRTSKRKESSERPGVQTRRKAYQETREAVLSESALEFQKLQQRQKINAGVPTPSLPMESIRSDLDITQPVSSPPIRVTKSRKPTNEDDRSLQLSRNIRFGGAIPGSLKAMKARIIAETGVQDGVRCARKDGSNDSSKWQCPMMAMEGHTLCEHHSFLNERKRARYAKARRQQGGDSRIGNKSSRSQVQEKPVAPRKQRMKHDVQSPSVPRSELLHNCDSDDLAGLDEVASQALLTMKSDILAVENLHREKPLYVPDFNPFEVDRSKPVQREGATKGNSTPQFFARSPTGRFIAAKKTTVKIPALETEASSLGKSSNVLSTRPPSIPPLPAFYGPRRKTVKNRSLLSIS